MVNCENNVINEGKKLIAEKFSSKKNNTFFLKKESVKNRDNIWRHTHLHTKHITQLKQIWSINNKVTNLSQTNNGTVNNRIITNSTITVKKNLEALNV